MQAILIMKNTAKIIIYDDTCPFCGAYTNAFVKTGLIAKENRKAFNNIDQNTLALIDIKRCVNEIPVIDVHTKQVWYGIDGLVEILQQKIPFIKPVANIQPIKYLLLKLYKFISFNRKVIVAPKATHGNFDCTPDFNLRYRLFFLFVFVAFNTLLLFPIHSNILTNSFINNTSIYQLQLAHFILIAVNITIASRLNKTDGFEYLGQANMLASITILLNLPLLVLNRYVQNLDPLINNVYLILITLFIIREYVRRMKFVGIFKTHQWIIFINIISITIFFIYLLN